MKKSFSNRSLINDQFYLAKLIAVFLVFVCFNASAQMNYTLVSSGGSWSSEKWMNITTAVNGGGTQVWGQGNGTYGNCAGLINTTIDLENYQGQTLYLNAWDKYADDWDGTKYTLTDENGTLVINNSNTSPDDGTYNDASGAWGNTQAEELESSEAFVVNSNGASISYDASSYCSTASDPTPTESNHAGAGTYSSTTGLVFVSASTGQIDLSASTAGTYTITYTDTDNSTATADVTIASSEYYVDDTGSSNSNNGTTSGSPFATIAYAITKVGCPTTTINVLAGTYGEEDIVVDKDGITIDGAGPGSTIFEGDYTDRFMTIVGNNVTLSDMHIKKYAEPSGAGNTNGGGALRIGGVADGSTTEYSTAYTGISITNVVFEDNYCNATSGDGGAVDVIKTDNASTEIDVDFSKCIFYDNKSGTSTTGNATYNGGAVKGDRGSDLSFTNCLFYENTAQGNGGVLAMYNDGEADFFNCTMADNNSHNGGGAIYAETNSDIVIRNCILYNSYDNGILHDDVYEGDGSVTWTWTNSVYRSEALSSSCTNCSTVDPGFTSASNDDYTIGSGSSAEDTGSADYAPSDDLLGVARPQGNGDDAGCYEYDLPVSISYDASAYCPTASDPTPTLSNNAGSGTYSSSAGLSINSTTGAIDLSASTIGAYIVTYLDTDSETATANVTISQPTVEAGSDVNYSAGATISLDATVSGNLSSSSTQVFSEDFGSGSLPSGWANSGGDESWLMLNSNPGYGTSTDNSAGSDNGMAWHDNSATGSAIMSTGALDLSSYSSAALTLYIFSSEGSKSTLDINVSTNGGTSYTNDVCTYNGDYTSWTQVTCDLSSYIGNNVKIQFQGNDIGNGGNDFNNDLGIDDVVLTGTNSPTYAWTTDASNGTSGWSATNTEDITVTSNATTDHIGNYTLTVTDFYGCSNSDVVAIVDNLPNLNGSSWTSGDGAFAECESTNSAEEEYTIKASNLTGDLTVTPPSGFEISLTSGASFTNSGITVAEAAAESGSGDVVYVRMASAGSSPSSGNITVTGGGLSSTQNIAVSGVITAIPSTPGTI